MKYTEELRLKKPDLTDYVNINDVNDNMDVIDETVSTNKINLTSHTADDVNQELGVHGFRIRDRKAQFLNEETGEWEDIKAGTEVKVGNVLNLSVDEDDTFVIIKWEDPGDAIIQVEGQDITFAEWGGTQLRYSSTNYPINEEFGELLVDNKVKNKYKDVGFKHIGLTNDVEGYYMLFPYTKDGAFTVDSANRISATPTEVDPNSWQGIQKIVRKGIANEFFSVGDQIASGYDGGEVIWEVIGIDVDTPVDSQLQHSMTIQTRDCLHDIQFDAPEPTNPDSNRKSNGNNRYIHSALRQWLNSDEVSFNWQSQHQYDAKPTSTLDIDDSAGFLNKLDPELTAVIGLAKKNVAKNTVTDGGGQESFTDKVFLLSPKEVGYTSSEMNDDGDYTGEVVYPFYDGVANAARIKNLNGSPRKWWLRSPNVSNSSTVRHVYTDGSLHNRHARSTSGVSPACVII